MTTTIAYFLGTHEDWGGASRALLNFIRTTDRTRYRPLVILTKEGKLSASLTREGIDWIVRRKHDRTRNIFRYGLDISDSVVFFRKNGVKLIHMNYGSIGWKPAEVLAARMLGIPLISHLHMVSPETSSYLKYSKAIIAVSEYVAKHSQTYNVPTHVIFNLSNMDRFRNGSDIRQELGLSRTNVIVLYMGVMMRQKGVELLVRAFKSVEGEQVRLVMAGPIKNIDGALTKAEVDHLVSEDSRIKYLGYRSDPENLYATADVIVMPSQLEEACAMIIFETAAAGKPLIATATGGTPEVVQHEKTGLLIDRSDTEALTRYIQLLVDDEQLRLRMGASARQLADKEYSVAPIQHLDSLYRSIYT